MNSKLVYFALALGAAGVVVAILSMVKANKLAKLPTAATEWAVAYPAK